MTPLARLAFVAALLAGCSGSSRASNPATPTAPAATMSATKILDFTVSNENLQVDKVGMRDGALRPDGTRDFAFTGTIDGPFEAVFVVSVNAKGEVVYGLRADTLTTMDELPPELGTIVDTGKMTVGVGVVENGSFINRESGSVSAGEGVHRLTFYVPNTAFLKAGDHVRIYVRTKDGTLVAGPIAAY